MPVPQRPRLQVFDCYTHAWRAFARWWIPLCLLAGLLVLLQIGPRLLLYGDVDRLLGAVGHLLGTLQSEDLDRTERAALAVSQHWQLLAGKLVRFTLYALPAVALVTVLLLTVAGWAGRNRRRRVGPLQAARTTLVHLGLTLVVTLGLAAGLLPGIYLYIKLWLTPLAMLEQNEGGLQAVGSSWRLSRGSFWPLALLALMNALLQGALAITVVGLIPATGFANTARAAAYQQLRDAWQAQGLQHTAASSGSSGKMGSQ